ncbi:glycosyltransferase [Wohlfahrtiimonas chitiniclastica]|uniref:glycosyltransferase family 2 protein n=1 Tax=Wohlfahrtiimonas chitiniclastica TaxID=400946 RepID=UPI0007B4099F|nr:glycosyltransferase [Wohlfahrtiimonas chitiniclastica]KZS23634.1 hypothetical protein BMY_1501 [Wohlfahrtiimonas chitiniclastica]WHR56027.1 glycosyltransferase [Wohlfahrtiimonas chitiniclastica]
MNHPLVSVIIPCYNHEQFVQECIQSVIDQDYQNIELIIIDDGSQDQSVQKIEEMRPQCEKRFVRFEFRHRPNKGLCATLNEALKWCEGEYYSPSASDDILLASKISKQVETLMSVGEDIVGVFCGVFVIDKSGNITSQKGRTVKKIDFHKVFLRSCFLPGQAVMLKTDIIRKINGYDEDILIEDLDLFLKIVDKRYYLTAISTPLVKYRRHNENLSSNHNLMIDAVSRILRKYQTNPLYPKALSNSYLIEAHGLQKKDKKKSRQYIRRALHLYPFNLLSKSLLKYIIKEIIK